MQLRLRHSVSIDVIIVHCINLIILSFGSQLQLNYFYLFNTAACLTLNKLLIILVNLILSQSKLRTEQNSFSWKEPTKIMESKTMEIFQTAGSRKRQQGHSLRLSLSQLFTDVKQTLRLLIYNQGTRKQEYTLSMYRCQPIAQAV